MEDEFKDDGDTPTDEELDLDEDQEDDEMYDHDDL